MRTKKNLIILLCAVILLGGIYLFVSRGGEKTDTKTEKNETQTVERTGTPVFETEKDKITSVKIENEDSFEIYKKDGKWHIRDYENILFNQSLLNSTVLDYVKVIPSLTVEETLENKASYGLDKPSASAVVTTDDGTTKTFYIGDSTKGGNGVYCMVSDDDHIYTVSNVLANNMSKTRNTYRDTALIDAAEGEITEINMNVYGFGNVSIKKLAEQKDVMTSWLMTKPFELGVYDEKFKEYVLTPIKSVTISEFISDNPTPEQLEKSGLVNPENYYEVKTADSSYKILIGNNYDGSYIVKRDDLPSVYLVPGEYFSFLSVDVFEYLNSYSYLPNRDDIESIKSEFDGEEYIFTQENYADKDNRKLYINGISVDDTVYTNGYKSIVGIKIDGRTKNIPETPSAPELTFTFKMSDGTTEKVSYVRINEMYMYQYVNDKCEFYVKSADVDTAKEGIEEALNKAENPESEKKNEEKTEKKTTNKLAYVIVALIICLIAVFPISMLVSSKKKK